MRIIDIHTHIFPDRIAQKAARSVGKFYDMPARCDGSLAGALREMDRAGVGRFAVHSVATAPAQVASINAFLLGLRGEHPDRILPFAAMHPDMPDLDRAVDEIVAQGFYGVKIHPDIQGFRVDDPRALALIGAVAGRLPMLIHAGDHRYDNSNPARIARVLDMFPSLTAILAHLGGWSEWEQAMESDLVGRRNVYVDTSSSLYAIKPARAAQIIRTFGADRVLFGTDYPMWTATEELERFCALDLTQDEREAILYQNAEALFG
jgi:predicted TIM-barrel fold metal-dependent hydrolase